MSRRRGYRSGQVVWVAGVPDRGGAAKPQPRPLLVIRPDPLTAASPLCCLAISTRRGDDPDDPAIEMPWNSVDGDTTGLREWCRVVLRWFVAVEPWDVVEVSGRVDPAFLARVLDERQRALDFGRP